MNGPFGFGREVVLRRAENSVNLKEIQDGSSADTVDSPVEKFAAIGGWLFHVYYSAWWWHSAADVSVVDAASGCHHDLVNHNKLVGVEQRTAKRRQPVLCH